MRELYFAMKPDVSGGQHLEIRWRFHFIDKSAIEMPNMASLSRERPRASWSGKEHSGD